MKSLSFNDSGKYLLSLYGETPPVIYSINCINGDEVALESALTVAWIKTSVLNMYSFFRHSLSPIFTEIPI